MGESRLTETESKPHSRGRYVIAIVAVGIIALLLGVFHGLRASSMVSGL